MNTLDVELQDFFIFGKNFGATAAGKRWAFAQVLDEDAALTLQANGGTRQQAGRITVRVWADGVEDLRAFGLVLGYEPHALTFQQAQEGPGTLLQSRGAGDLRLRFTCGLQDRKFIDENQELHALLEELGIPHEYQESRGKHSWEYWTSQLETHLRFHAEYLSGDGVR